MRGAARRPPNTHQHKKPIGILHPAGLRQSITEIPETLQKEGPCEVTHAPGGGLVVEGSRSNQPQAGRARTAKAVAEWAGVSVTTVSRVLNGRGEAIPETTRSRVLAAAHELGYRPNSLAAALRKGITRTIGLLVPDIADAYFHQVARGVEDTAQAAGYMVIVCNTDRIAEKELAYVQLLHDKRADAIIFAGGGVDEEKHLAQYDWEHMRAVTIGPHRLPFPSIRVDDAGVIETAVQHLTEEGCRRILCIAGKPNWLITETRLEGHRRGVEKAGLAFDPELVVYAEFSQEAGYMVAQQALADGTDFDGILAFNDYLAIGAIQGLHACRRNVPGDVAVIGCDDIPAASLVRPQLSSVGFSQYEFGRGAMRAVLDMADGKSVEETTIFPYYIEKRASTKRTSHGHINFSREIADKGPDKGQQGDV